jgi:hypothetical protein
MKTEIILLVRFYSDIGFYLLNNIIRRSRREYDLNEVLVYANIFNLCVYVMYTIQLKFK